MVEYMKATDAAELSEKNAAKLSEHQIRSVMQEIGNATSRGERSIKYFSSINNITLEKIKSLGYHILEKKQEGIRDDLYYKIISW